MLNTFLMLFDGVSHTLRVENFQCNLIFSISLMAISLNSNSVYYYSFRNLSMIAYIIEIQ